MGGWNKTHGEGWPPTRLWMTWRNMRRRCYNQHGKDWKRYGGRGIAVHERWHIFENFREDVGPHPGKGWSLDRPRNNEYYGPDNWRWASPLMQARNRRSNKITPKMAAEIYSRHAAGETARALGREFGLSCSTISYIRHHRIQE